jgi:hypothetical protein
MSKFIMPQIRAVPKRKRLISSLFVKGRKPKALFGGTTKKKRLEYKRIKGQGTGAVSADTWAARFVNKRRKLTGKRVLDKVYRANRKRTRMRSVP